MLNFSTSARCQECLATATWCLAVSTAPTPLPSPAPTASFAPTGKDKGFCCFYGGEDGGRCETCESLAPSGSYCDNQDACGSCGAAFYCAGPTTEPTVRLLPATFKMHLRCSIHAFGYQAVPSVHVVVIDITFTLSTGSGIVSSDDAAILKAAVASASGLDEGAILSFSVDVRTTATAEPSVTQSGRKLSGAWVWTVRCTVAAPVSAFNASTPGDNSSGGGVVALLKAALSANLAGTLSSGLSDAGPVVLDAIEAVAATPRPSPQPTTIPANAAPTTAAQQSSSGIFPASADAVASSEKEGSNSSSASSGMALVGISLGAVVLITLATCEFATSLHCSHFPHVRS